MASYDEPSSSVTLDIHDTCNIPHGHQQLSLFNAHYDERCFLPIHVYDTEKSRLVAGILRTGKTPSRGEVRAHLHPLTRSIRKSWPASRILFRGEGHYAWPEAMALCDDHGVDYVFGLPGTKPLSKKVDGMADAVCVECAIDDPDGVLGYAETRHCAKSWDRGRCAIARIEATRLGLDIRFVVTNLPYGAPQWLYDSLYCARGQAENLIKLHKTQLSSDRTSCRSALANQLRLVSHTAAYWQVLRVRDAIPAPCDLAKVKFSTLRLLKAAGRVIETASRVRLAPSPPPVPKPISSAPCWPRCSCLAAHERRGSAPLTSFLSL
ncbi:DDE family transposase [Methylosinus sp. sav-2]|nr:DDE family transposase [Methylosinus sp. sav-2]